MDNGLLEAAKTVLAGADWRDFHYNADLKALLNAVREVEPDFDCEVAMGDVKVTDADNEQTVILTEWLIKHDKFDEDHDEVMLAFGDYCDPLMAAHRIQSTKALQEQLAERDAVIEELEWSGEREGQGSGPHSSGGDGPLFAACPVCGGLKEPNGHFNEEAVGHRDGCKLNALTKEKTYA